MILTMIIQFALLILMTFVFIIMFAGLMIADWILYRFDEIREASGKE